MVSYNLIWYTVCWLILEMKPIWWHFPPLNLIFWPFRWLASNFSSHHQPELRSQRIEKRIKVTRFKEMITNERRIWLLNKFSLSTSLKDYIMDSMENMHTDVRVQRVNILLGASKTCELISFNLNFVGLSHIVQFS